MKRYLRDILTSDRTIEDEDESYQIALYIAFNEDNKRYYSATIDNPIVIELAETYINKYASVDIYGNDMYTADPMHILKYKDDYTSSHCHVLMYSNGAVCLEQTKHTMIVHVWISESTANMFRFISVDEFNMLSKKITSDESQSSTPS
jgi:hypothetical protein